MQIVIPILFALIALSYDIFQLVTGVAFVGFSEDGFLRRSESPGPFWFLMIVQVLIQSGMLFVAFNWPVPQGL